MKVTELNRDQLYELKTLYLTEMQNNGELEKFTGFSSISWGMFIDVDDFISDNKMYDHYANTEFVDDDFSCSACMVG